MLCGPVRTLERPHPRCEATKTVEKKVMSDSKPNATTKPDAFAAIRDEFPVLRQVTYMNTASNGLIPERGRRVLEDFFTKHHYLVTDVGDVARVVKEAFLIASTGRPGPVLIDMPKDVQLDKTVPDYDAAPDLPGFCLENPKAHPEQINQIAAAIRLAKRPVIYVGGGAEYERCSPDNRVDAIDFQFIPE